MKKYPFYQQLDWNDCGPSCIKMIAKYYGRDFDLEYLRGVTFISNNGVSMFGISEGLQQIHLNSLMVQITYEKLINDLPTPAILYWNNSHFVVLYEKKKKGSSLFRTEDSFVIADPAHEVVSVDKTTFLRSWIASSSQEGIAMTVYPSPEFYLTDAEKKIRSGFFSGITFLYKYVRPYRRYFFQIAIGILVASAISLIFPFLTQIMVDHGVSKKNYSLLSLILMSQVLLFTGETLIEVIRNRILLNINARIGMAVISDFLGKLMKLPMKFFDSRSTGDLTQRIQDHQRVEEFLTGTSLSTFFSLISIIIFSIILSLYNISMFLVFLSLSAISIIWILMFLSGRKNIDYKRFQRQQENQDTLLEIIRGIKEIKLNNSETSRRWRWERAQLNIFNINLKSLRLDQYQVTGFDIITQLKNMLVSFFSATLTIQGEMTLGMMLSVSYIIGQTNGPLQRLALFFRSAQDAQISLQRLQEIHKLEDEKVETEIVNHAIGDVSGDIRLTDLTFQYGTSKSKVVLNKINMVIPKGKVTAVVGTSGSGKTTLLKLLLRFYEPINGEITVNDINLQNIDPRLWRSQCGTVMQDGYIFADSIAQNIAVDGEKIDKERLRYAIKIANLEDVIASRPSGLHTVLSSGGGGLSGGQLQRILIARAVYKNPEFLFFDEATSSLDANNEKKIIENLSEFFEGKTVFIIAHRLSTVKNAHQIVMMSEGRVVESGNHLSLVALRGHYYNLVKNQLELDGA
jgi:ATP-binding cassette subfamily B protein